MRETRLYFMSVPGRIKIGISVKVKDRRKEIQRAVKQQVALLGDVPGSMDFERHLHALAGEHALGGEWFNDCEAVREIVDRVLDGDLLGFEPKATIQPQRQGDLTYEEWLRRFNSFVRMVFPIDHVSGFSGLFDLPREQVIDYLTGEVEVPDLICDAWGAHLVGWVLKNHLEQKQVNSRR